MIERFIPGDDVNIDGGDQHGGQNNNMNKFEAKEAQVPTRKEAQMPTAANAQKEVNTPTAEESRQPKSVSRAVQVQPISVSRVTKYDKNNNDDDWNVIEMKKDLEEQLDGLPEGDPVGNDTMAHSDGKGLGFAMGDGTKLGEATNETIDNEIEEIFKKMRDNPTMAKAIISGMGKEETAFFNSLEEELNKNEARDDPHPPLFGEPDLPPCPSTPKPPPGSLLSEIQRPQSPTGINEFPFEEIDMEKYNVFDINHKTTNILPRFRTNKVAIQQIVDEVKLTDEYVREDPIRDIDFANGVISYTVVADIGTFGRTFKMNRCEVHKKGGLSDTGANCCMTADKTILRNLRELDTPMLIGVAVTHDGPITSSAECTHVGDLPIYCDNGDEIVAECFYNPNATDTIISPQAIIDDSNEFTEFKQIGRKFGQPGQLTFTGPKGSKTITLQQRNGLYFINSTMFKIQNDTMATTPHFIPTTFDGFTANKVQITESATQTMPKQPRRMAPPSNKYQPTSKAKILESETWYLRMGGGNEQSLEKLTQHALGIPKHFEWHPFRYIDFREQARVRKQPVGRNPQKVSERGSRFYMDFGFIRASNEDFTKKTTKTDRVVESFDGYTSYLLIVDEVSKYAWIFLTKTKEPPVELTKLFLREFGNENGGLIRCDQGGELARSTAWRTAMLKDFQYKIEPTGADSPSQNGQVERYNELIGTTVRTLLYGANLPAKYWSAAAVHAVYLLNRRFHSALNMTPYEAWWDEKPDLSLLKVFGSRVCVRVTGKRSSKLDRHDFSGIFIGYTATNENIRYIDVESGLVKTTHHAVFDEAWYLQPYRPPMAQLLFDMGMEVDDDSYQAPPDRPRQPAPWPPTPTAKAPPTTPSPAKLEHLPLRISATPECNNHTARAAKVDMPKINRVNIIADMNLDKEEVFAQVYLSPSPYFEAFEEEIDLRKWNLNDHHTAGLVLIQKDESLVLANILKSTPAAKIDKWRSRCRGATVLEVDGRPVQSQVEVEAILKNLKARDCDFCKITLAHPEIKYGLTSQGLPQLHIDQLNTRAIMNVELVLQKQEAPKIISGGVQQYSFCKLTRGKLIRQDDWNEWRDSEWLQLDQYYEQGMFGDPVYVKDKTKIFNLVWTYNIKDLDKRKKARCACDGSTRGGKVRIFDYTHANCVEHTASRLFYGITAAENLLIFGADVSNAFGEAPPPKQGFYIQPDRAFIEWWSARGRPPIHQGQAIPVRRAMQGHPEASRLWEKHIDKIVRELKFKPTTHEPCIYEGYIRGERCIFKRQVDDFALATQRPEIAHEFFDLIDDRLKMPMKRFGIVTLFNGVDILQSRHYVKMSVQTYLEKIGEKHLEAWMHDLKDMANRPLPMPATDSFKKSFETAIGDPDEKAQAKLEKEYKFKYRSGIGEIIYAMVTCRPDVSTATHKCAQHSACPAKPHYNAVRHILKYLYTTRDDGIYFWRVKPLMDLPEHPLPRHCASQHGQISNNAHRPVHDPLVPYTFVDSD